MLGLTDEMEEIDRGREDGGVTHLIKRVGEALMQVGQEIGLALADDVIAMPDMDVEAKSEMVTQIALFDQKYTDLIDGRP